MRILVDVDSTLVHTLTYWLNKIKDKFGVHVSWEEINTYNLFKHPALAHLGADAIDAMLQEPNFVYAIPLMEGAVDVIKKWNEKHEVYFVTAREGPVSMPDTLRWYKDHFPFMKKNQLIFCQDKHLLKADILIDDSPFTIEKHHEDWKDTRVLGIRYGYNDHCNKAWLVDYSADSWRDLDMLVNANSIV